MADMTRTMSRLGLDSARAFDRMKLRSVFTDVDMRTDRTTQIGQMIDSYLKSAVRMDDHAIHLLFSANRWEAAYVYPLPCNLTRKGKKKKGEEKKKKR